jgi:WD40 repeat protein
MWRIIAVCVAVVVFTLVRPAVAADPVPVWSADLSDKQNHRTFIDWLGYAPDGQVLVARALITKMPPGDQSRPLEVSQLVVVDVLGRRERLRLDPKVVREPRPGPPCAFHSSGLLLTADGPLIDTTDGKPVGTRNGHVAGPVGVWVSAGGREYIRIRGGEGVETTVVRGALPRPGDKQEKPRKESAAQLVAHGWRLVCAAAVTPDGTRVAVAGLGTLPADEVLTLYQFKAGDAVGLATLGRVGASHPLDVWTLQFSPDGRVLASGDPEGKLKLWDEPKPGGEWKPRATVGGPDFGVLAIAFRPDGRVLAFGTGDRKKSNVWLVDVASGKLLRSFRAGGAGGQVTSVAFSPDGKALATGLNTGRLEVWDAEALLRGD